MVQYLTAIWILGSQIIWKQYLNVSSIQIPIVQKLFWQSLALFWASGTDSIDKFPIMELNNNWNWKKIDNIPCVYKWYLNYYKSQPKRNIFWDHLIIRLSNSARAPEKWIKRNWTHCSIIVLTYLFARSNVEDNNYIYTLFITVPFQVRSITNWFVPLQSGSVFYQRTKLTGAQYKQSYIYIGW